MRRFSPHTLSDYTLARGRTVQCSVRPPTSIGDAFCGVRICCASCRGPNALCVVNLLRATPVLSEMAPKAVAKGAAKAAAKAKAKAVPKAKPMPRPRPVREATLAEGRLVNIAPPLVPFILFVTEQEERIERFNEPRYNQRMVNEICEFFANSQPVVVARYLGVLLRFRPSLLGLVAANYSAVVCDIHRTRVHMHVGLPIAVTPYGVVRSRPFPTRA